jgi:sulfur carrier protein
VPGYAGGVKVKLRNPDRVVEVSGPGTVSALLEKLDIVPEAVLVIRDATLLTRDERVADDDEIEVRPVLSGGSIGADASSLVDNCRRAAVNDQTTSRGRSQ